MKKLMSAVFALLFAAGLAGAHAVHAADDSAWDKPVVTLGSSLTDAQKQGTENTLTASLNGGTFDTLTVNGDTLVKYLNPSGSNFTSSSGVWSSAMVNKTANGGINVHILDYNGVNNITTITADQYRNAAVTAGVSNADIYITSAVRIDGSGALAGVYAAFAEHGQTLSSSQIAAAQSEVSTLSGITQANKNEDGYSDKQLNNAVAGMKKDMASQSNNGEQTLSQNQIGNIVDSQLKNNNLGTIINNNQRTQIINLLVKIQSSGALKNSDFKAQASKLASSIQDSAKGLFSKIKSSVNSEEGRNFFQKILDAISNFFSSLISWVQSLF
ncbi:DUF1002 domain-containing protein [Lacticaseibacillus songhuajiangensis]|jgi:uncharacterized protein YpuA (DUF1002 family)|uniref:DUF1002 domain-containing protein n=1 Tax=Lacticaseibacillus songhuajiangensis TaxID=1296539 RepID=UPI000F7AA484|nr:DUF1002 domain-containing protein [Lacticaseibacillus songhuajiangensis]